MRVRLRLALRRRSLPSPPREGALGVIQVRRRDQARVEGLVANLYGGDQGPFAARQAPAVRLVAPGELVAVIAGDLYNPLEHRLAKSPAQPIDFLAETTVPCAPVAARASPHHGGFPRTIPRGEASAVGAPCRIGGAGFAMDAEPVARGVRAARAAGDHGWYKTCYYVTCSDGDGGRVWPKQARKTF